MKRRLSLLFACLVAGMMCVNAQVTIGTTNDPHAGAVLDLQSINKGFLLPKVSLNDASKFQLATDAEAASGVGMMVYNTNAGMEGGGVGVYVWDGAKWTTVGETGNVAVDKSNLQKLVDQVSQYVPREAEYTPETFAPFKTAYNAALAVLASATASQSEVDATWTTLAEATTDLRLKPVKVPVASVKVAYPERAKLGAPVAMYATVLPDNATSKTLTWSVTNGTGAATIDPTTGILTGTALGTVTVIATATDNGVASPAYTATVVFEVGDPVNQKIGNNTYTTID